MAIEAPPKVEIKTPEPRPGNLDGWMKGLQEQYQNNPTTEKLAPNVQPPESAAAAPTVTPPAAPKKEEAAAKPEPKKVELTDADREQVAKDIEEGKWPRNADQWDKFKAVSREKTAALAKERDELRAKLTEAEKQITAAPKQEAPPDYEDIKKQRDEFEQIIRKTQVADHPQFRAHYDGKEAAQLEMAKRIVGEQNAGRVAELLKMQDSPYRHAQMEEVLGSLGTIEQIRLGGVINALEEIRTERQSEIEKAKDNASAIQKANEEHVKTSRVNSENAFNAQAAKLSDAKTGHPAFQHKEGDEAWNRSVDERIAVAKGILFGSNKPETVMTAALHAAAYPSILQQSLNQAKEIDSLKAQIAKLSAAAPRIEGGGAPAGGDGGDGSAKPVEHKSGSRPMDAAANFMKGLPSIRS